MKEVVLRMDDNTDEKFVEDGKFSTSNGNKAQEQSTAAPTVPGEGSGVEQPVAAPVKTNELNDDTEPSKDDKASDDQKVPEGDGEPENAKADGDREAKDSGDEKIVDFPTPSDLAGAENGKAKGAEDTADGKDENASRDDETDTLTNPHSDMEFYIDAEKKQIVINGLKTGDRSVGGVSGALIARALDEYVRSVEPGEDGKVSLGSIVLSKDVKSVTADAFNVLGNRRGITYDALTLISQKGDYSIQTESCAISPFACASKYVKAFVFNEKIPSGMTEKRDGRNSVKGVFEGVGPALVMAVGVKDVPERAFARSKVSFISVNNPTDTLTVGSEAFSMRTEGFGDAAKYQATAKDLGVSLTERERESINGKMKDFFVRTIDDGVAEMTDLSIRIEALEDKESKARKVGELAQANLYRDERSKLAKERAAIRKEVGFAVTLVGAEYAETFNRGRSLEREIESLGASGSKGNKEKMDALQKELDDIREDYEAATLALGNPDTDVVSVEGKDGITKLRGTLDKVVGYGDKGLCAVAFHNISSTIHDGAFSGKDDARFIYTNEEPKDVMYGFSTELESSIQKYLEKIVPELDEGDRNALSDAVRKDLAKNSVGIRFLNPKAGDELLKNIVDKVVEKKGAGKADDKMVKDVTARIRQSMADNGKLFRDLAAMYNRNDKYRKALDNGTLFATSLGTSVGKKAFFGTAVSAIMQAKGKHESQRVEIDLEKEIREYNIALQKLQRPDSLSAKELEELTADIKRREGQLAEAKARLANVSLKDEAFSGMENLAVTNLDYDGVAKDIYKHSGNRMAGIVSEKKDENGKTVIGRLIGLEEEKDQNRWKPTPMEVVASYYSAWSVTRKMSLIDQFFDFAKNLLILGTAGLVVGIRAVPGLVEKAGEKFGKDQKFEQPVRLTVRDDVADMDVSLTSKTAWENYGRLRAAYADALSSLGKKVRLVGGNEGDPELTKRILVASGIKEKDVDRMSVEKRLKEIGKLKEKGDVAFDQAVEKIRRDMERDYKKSVSGILLQSRAKTMVPFPENVKFDGMVKAVAEGGLVSGIPLFLFGLTVDGKSVAGEAVLVDDGEKRSIVLRGMKKDGVDAVLDTGKLAEDFASMIGKVRTYTSNFMGANLESSENETIRKAAVEAVRKCMGNDAASEFDRVTNPKEGARTPADIAEIQKTLDEYTSKLEAVANIAKALDSCVKGDDPRILAKLQNRDLEGVGARVLKDEKSGDRKNVTREDGGTELTRSEVRNGFEKLLASGNSLFGSVVFAEGMMFDKEELKKRSAEPGSFLAGVDTARLAEGVFRFASDGRNGVKDNDRERGARRQEKEKEKVYSYSNGHDEGMSR